MAALPPFVQIVKYGNTRKTDVESVKKILDQVIPRICIGLTNVCIQLDEDEAKRRFEQLTVMHQSLQILNNPAHSDYWMTTLETNRSVPLLNSIR